MQNRWQLKNVPIDDYGKQLPLPGRRAGYVYIIQDIEVSHRYKIGKTNNPQHRIGKQFGVELPFEIRLVHLLQTEDATAVENALHQRYAKNRKRGEWFELNDSQLQEIRNLGAPPKRGEDIERKISVSLLEAYKGVSQRVNVNGRDILVQIPRGVTDQARLQQAGKGHPGINGGAPGDLYAVVHIVPNARFTRKGDDLYIEVDVKDDIARLGGEVKVPTMTDAVDMTVPAGTQSGQKIPVAGKGMPKRVNANAFGDLYVKVKLIQQKPVSSKPSSAKKYQAQPQQRQASPKL